MFEDRTLSCVDCDKSFVFTVSEQEFHAEKGFQNDPKRCQDCRTARKASTNGRSSSGFGGAREMFDVICATCGIKTQVPFQPRNDRPVYCRDCFKPPERQSRSSW